MNSPKKSNATKEWWIFIEQEKEGPYSIKDLSKDGRFTLKTLVWKEGFIEWVEAQKVPELLELFLSKKEKPFDSQLVLIMEKDPYQKFVWFFLFLFSLVYLFYVLRGF